LLALGGQPPAAAASAPAAGDKRAVRTGLAAAEGAAAEAGRADALRARSAGAAQLLASIAASEATHTVLLGTDGAG
jgi:hypothetical protein